MSTDPARLTDDEREDLWRAYESWTEGDFSEHMGEAVEVILADRLPCMCQSHGNRPQSAEQAEVAPGCHRPTVRPSESVFERMDRK